MTLGTDSAGGSSNHIDTVYNGLRERIFEGQIRADELITEAGLSEQFGVSRTPIRSALLLLEHDDIIQRASRGYLIKGGTPQELMHLYDVRIELEGLAARETAARRTELDLAALAQSIESSGGVTDPVESDEHLLHFHRLVWEGSHNPVLIGTLERLMSRLRLIDVSVATQPVPPGASDDEHKEVLDAIRAGDGQRARDALVSHLVTVRDIRRDAVVASMGRVR